jgi:hypothetical protein
MDAEAVTLTDNSGALTVGSSRLLAMSVMWMGRFSQAISSCILMGQQHHNSSSIHSKSTGSQLALG